MRLYNGPPQYACRSLGRYLLGRLFGRLLGCRRPQFIEERWPDYQALPDDWSDAEFVPTDSEMLWLATCSARCEL